jgi:glycerophosphoryl diester phosphodiesterase
MMNPMKKLNAPGIFLPVLGTLFSLVNAGCKKQTREPVLPDTLRKLEVYAHRGARSYAPENTIPGYTTGLTIGTDWVDMDIVMSQDGEVIVSHDIRLIPDLVSKLISWGVDGIITDDPGMLISMLAARNYTLPARY